MALGNKVAKLMYSPLAILSLILVGITGSGDLDRLAGDGRMVTAGIVAGSGVLVTADNMVSDKEVVNDVTAGNEVTT